MRHCLFLTQRLNNGEIMLSTFCSLSTTSQWRFILCMHESMYLCIYLLLLMHVFCAIDEHIYSASIHSRGKESVANMYSIEDIFYETRWYSQSPLIFLFLSNLTFFYEFHLQQCFSSESILKSSSSLTEKFNSLLIVWFIEI